MNFSWEKLAKPILCLAPMAGYTDSAYRQIVKEIEPNTICFSELASINALGHNSEKTMKMLEFAEKEQPLIMQLFGSDPDFFAEAGKKLALLPKSKRPSGIDINMGCPAQKVVKNAQGSALLKTPDLAAQIASKLVKAVNIPISVKMRIGYGTYDENHFLTLIKALEKTGISALTIHGRTTKQAFSGKADFTPIYLAKSVLKIPVIGNGDIDSPEKAREALTSPDGKITLDGLMVGRASIGNPWIMKEIREAMHKKSQSPTRKPATETKFHTKLPTIKKHFLLAITLYGERIGLLEMRKHLGEYISGIPNASKYRVQIMQAENPEKVLEILESIS